MLAGDQARFESGDQTQAHTLNHGIPVSLETWVGIISACLGRSEQTCLLGFEVRLRGCEKLQWTFPPSLSSPPRSPAAVAATPPAGGTRVKGASQCCPSLWEQMLSSDARYRRKRKTGKNKSMQEKVGMGFYKHCHTHTSLYKAQAHPWG